MTVRQPSLSLKCTRLCRLMYSIPTATVLHHLAVAPMRIGNPTPHDGHWHLTANQPIGGHQITVNLPRDFFTQGLAVQPLCLIVFKAK